MTLVKKKKKTKVNVVDVTVKLLIVPLRPNMKPGADLYTRRTFYIPGVSLPFYKQTSLVLKHRGIVALRLQSTDIKLLKDSFRFFLPPTFIP